MAPWANEFAEWQAQQAAADWERQAQQDPPETTEDVMKLPQNQRNNQLKVLQSTGTS